MNKNLPQIKREGLFIKIKKWFLTFFKKQKSVENCREEILKQAENKTDFMDKIKVENKDEILMLQTKIKERKMEISDLTNQELDELIELYKEQIKEKKMKLKQYRKKLLN